MQSPERTEVESLAQKCLDAPGYVMFVACLSNKRDKEGAMIIESSYRRYHFAIEDARGSVDVFKNFIEDDMQKIIREMEGG